VKRAAAGSFVADVSRAIVESLAISSEGLRDEGSSVSLGALPRSTL
jgi:hypothetical protein